ncbi:DUF4190 domain-containing protein [Microbacterium sufflavum]|uniref:DUF4190 domain-containing protein n=1 Tax=Microbacterium sufflavum TaxID=2851649 RepID=A0ABY4IFI7_9MICO|nr:DUF4190 domain-containing protein [Microbacterium sufflavum]MBN6190566.1 DUF4190 domain-containing protein [Aneurinibacillus sp. BA2021]UPL11364.1 DUF4190 domain-containing protein [Microbacterium sufflavum]
MTNPPPPEASQPGTPPPAWNSTPANDPAAAYPPPPGPAAPGAYGQTAPASPPGRVLSIVGLVLAFLLPPIGLILSIIAAVQLGKAHAPKGLAIAGIIVGAVLTILEIIGIILLVTVFAGIFGMCAELGPGVWEVGGVTYRCG